PVLLLISAGVFSAPYSLFAQSVPAERSTHSREVSLHQPPALQHSAALGLQINQYQQDFGFGLNFTSPYFANERIALRLRGNLMYNQHVLDGETQWTPYAN